MRLRVDQVDFRRTKAGWEARKGRRRVGIISTEYPHMWRVIYPDGTLSDMVNLARAKDAAFGIIEAQDFVNAPKPISYGFKSTGSLAH